MRASWRPSIYTTRTGASPKGQRPFNTFERTEHMALSKFEEMKMDVYSRTFGAGLTSQGALNLAIHLGTKGM